LTVLARRVVHKTVAIVIDGVTSFILRRQRDDVARPPLFTPAIERSDRHTGTSTVVARLALVNEPIVHLAIAVVVSSIALLEARAAWNRITSNTAVTCADEYALARTRPDARRTPCPEPEAVVDDPVAVVVDRVAQLQPRLSGHGVTHSCPIRPAHEATTPRARPDPSGTRSADRHTVVDDAIAIVV